MKLKSKNLNRREFIKTVGVRTASVALPLFSSMLLKGCKSFESTSEKSSPNIIFLLTDDQRWDSLGCMGNSIVKTPNIDKLAKKGFLFKNAFVTTSICMTSRASCLTGQYACRHKINDFYTNLSPEAFSETYPALLKNAGYRTGFVGKYGIGNQKMTDEFDVWNGIPGPGQPVYENKDEKGEYKHLTEIITDQSIDFLKCCSKENPFCLSVSYKAPHVQDSDSRQFIYNPIYEDLYKDVSIPLPKTATQKHFDALPDFLKNSEARERWKNRFATPEMYQKSVKGYYKLIAGIDDSVKNIRKELKKLKLENNTVIIFMGDNGFFLGEHGLAGKWFAHEESIRVPLIIYDPRMEKSNQGKSCEEMALNIDIAPTILDLAGEPVSEKMQGKSLLPLLKNQNQNWRKDFYYEHNFEHETLPKSESVRTKNWKYIRYVDKKPGFEELYNLKKDPFEENNLSTNLNYKSILKKLQKRCDEFKNELI